LTDSQSSGTAQVTGPGRAYKAGAVENAAQQSRALKPTTQVFYGDGAPA